MYESLTVYHGGTDIIQLPRVNVGRINLDFGPGFYVTDIYTQSKDWARRMSNERNNPPIINSYLLLRQSCLSKYNCLIFDSYDKAWLDFVTNSRLGRKPWQDYDYIEGGVADDRVVDTIRLYMGGYIPADVALARLKYFKPANQICLLNQTLVNECLSFIESNTIE